MADKYIRVSNDLHETLKTEAAQLRISLKALVEWYTMETLNRHKEDREEREKTDIIVRRSKSTGQKE